MFGEATYREARKDQVAGFCGELPGDLDEDFTYVNTARIGPIELGSAILALHRLAAAHPLVIEFGEELPVQEEMVTHAFGLGAAGVVAPAMRPAVSAGRQNVWMLSAGELLPFAHSDGTRAPLSAVTPMISVVAAARDDEGTIAACLESIGRLQYPNYEVIVVDDGSRDRTADIAASIGGPRLTRVIREPRVGFGAACNAAVRAARGDFIAFTRGDCIVDADWLGMTVRSMFEGSLDACRGPIYPSRSAADGLAARALAALANSHPVDAAEDYAGSLTDRNMILRKASLIAVGGFDARFIDEGGGADLWARMIEARMTLGWCPAGFVWRSACTRVGEFYRRRLGRGRADGMLALKHPGRFGVAVRRTHPMAILERSRQARFDEARDGAVVRSLSAIFSWSGAMVQAVARHHYTIVGNRVRTAANASNGDDYDATRHLRIPNSHVSTANPGAHH
jgi:GT2 family glycosyltransferase